MNTSPQKLTEQETTDDIFASLLEQPVKTQIEPIVEERKNVERVPLYYECTFCLARFKHWNLTGCETRPVYEDKDSQQ